MVPATPESDPTVRPPPAALRSKAAPLAVRLSAVEGAMLPPPASASVPAVTVVGPA